MSYQVKGMAGTLRTGSPPQLAKSGDTLAVKAIGTHFTFYINGEQVAEVNDDCLTSGEIGFDIGVGHSGFEVTWTFDDFIVLAP